MVNYIKGNILDVTKGIIVQQVNCQGVMGAGLAKQIRDKWPVVYDNYKDKVDTCQNRKDLLGNTSFSKVSIDTPLYVASIFGQFNYGRSGRFTIYPVLFKGLEYIFRLSEVDKIPVYIPKGLGCGLAGGNWEFVEEYIRDLDYIFDNKLDIIIVEKVRYYVCD